MVLTSNAQHDNCLIDDSRLHSVAVLCSPAMSIFTQFGHTLQGQLNQNAATVHSYNPVTPAYSVWAYYAHGRQRRCQEDPVSLWQTGEDNQVVPASRGSAPSNTPYALRSSRFGSEPPSVEDDVDMALRNPELHARNDDDDDSPKLLNSWGFQRV